MSRFHRVSLSFLVPAVLWLLSVIPVHGTDEAYVIGAADVLEVQVWDNKDLNQVVFVRPDGKISLPLIGEVQAGGKTVQQLQDALAELYTKVVKGANVTVIIKEIKSRPVYFIGGFAKPGVEQLTRACGSSRRSRSSGGSCRRRTGTTGFSSEATDASPSTSRGSSRRATSARTCGSSPATPWSRRWRTPSTSTGRSRPQGL